MIAFLLALIVFPTHAKTPISISKFEDKATPSSCPATADARSQIDTKIQTELINALIKKFEIQQREIRPIQPKHQFVGAVRQLEVCPRGKERGQQASIAIEVQVLDANGSMTHLFSGSANTSSSKMGRAGQDAIRAATREIARRINTAFGEKEYSAVPGGRGSKSNIADYKVQLIRRQPASTPRR